MKGLSEEINEIPLRAREVLRGYGRLQLPTNVPYVGMGSSYFAAQTLQYCDRRIQPQIASEYYGYLSPGRLPLGVLLSQSGESSETVWCRDLFDSYVAIVNEPESSLGADSRVSELVELYAGEEEFSSTKTYVNTLLVLYVGLGIDPTAAVERVETEFANFRDQAKQQADEIAEYFDSRHVLGRFVVGSGPNVGTASQAALVLSETLKSSWVSMPVAQYDHGPKETAEDSLVILLDARGREAKRTETLRTTLREGSNALVVDLVEDEVGETLSAVPLIVRANLLMDALADRLDVGHTFALGGKVTTVSDDARPV